MAHYLSNMSRIGGMVVPKEYYEKVGKDEFQKHPIGSGPYKWHSQQAGFFIKLEAADKHWRDGVPRYKYMTYSYYPGGEHPNGHAKDRQGRYIYYKPAGDEGSTTSLLTG